VAGADASTYAPRLRTAVVFSGTGTAGAYHAGVLRALAEAGVKVDLVAGRGIGAASALLGALDAGTRLWQPSGAWDQPAIARLYRWRLPWAVCGWALLLAALVLSLPMLVQLVAALLYPFAYAAALLGLDREGRLSAWFLAVIDASFNQTVFAIVIPRVAVLSLLGALLFLALEYLMRRATRHRRSMQGRPWWMALGAPLDAMAAYGHFAGVFWSSSGKAGRSARDRAAASRRYVEMLADGLGQPGSAELVLAVHDLDTRRDLVFAVLQEPWRRRFFQAGGGSRDGEVVDVLDGGRALVMDGLAAALTVPLVSEPHPLTFPVDSYWRGETHVLTDRPEALVRLLEEVSAAGAEQVVVVNASAPVMVPHGLSSRQADPRAWLGQNLASQESAAVRDAMTVLFDRFTGLYLIQPTHNPIGPLDFTGARDHRSDRDATLAELVTLGYEDAYAQFIEPVVGGSAEGVERPVEPRGPAVDADLPLA
jgi:hypothetical protein